MNPTLAAPPLVSIITVNYNQPQVTCDFLASLQRISYQPIEVFVVDNASQESPKALIESRFPEVQVIVSPVNLGFAGGNNLAVRQARGKYLLFLNNDTEVEAHFLEPLVALLEADNRIGMASPKLIFYGTSMLQYAGAYPIDPFTGRGKSIGTGEEDKGQYNDVRPTALVHGAAMLVSRVAIEQAGLMPELFFLYYEELDWCEMIKRAGYTVYYVGSSTVYHKESVSVGRNNPMKTYYLTRNRLVFMRRNVKGFQFWVSFLFFTFISIPKNVLFFLLSGQWAHLRAFVRGVTWNVFHHNIFYNLFLEPEKKTAPALSN